MTYRSTTIVSLIAVFTLITFSSCDILDTGEDNVNVLRLNFNTTESVVEGGGGNTIEVTNVKFVLGDFNLLTPRFVPEQDTVVVDTTSFDDTFPRIVSFSPGEQGRKVKLGEIEPQTYILSHLSIHPPSGGVSDSDLGSNNSIIIEGTYNGTGFSMNMDHDTALNKNIFPQYLEMTDQTATLNLDVLIKTETMFKRSASRLYDPTTQAAKDSISKYFFRFIKLEEGTRTLRRYQNMR